MDEGFTRLSSLKRDEPVLTERELEVLRLVAMGYSSKQIAHELGVSFKTAVTHRASIMQKLGAHEVTALVRYAIRQGIVSVDQKNM